MISSRKTTYIELLQWRRRDVLFCPHTIRIRVRLTTEEAYMVMQSYEYRYDVGGRYNVIDVYDVCGNLIYQVSLK